MHISKLLAVGAVVSAMGSPASSSVTVTIDAGPNAGTYSLLHQDVGCVIQSADPPKPKHSFYSQNGDETKSSDPKALTIAYLSISDADVSGPNPSYYVQVNCGDTPHGPQ